MQELRSLFFSLSCSFSEAIVRLSLWYCRLLMMRWVFNGIVWDIWPVWDSFENPSTIDKCEVTKPYNLPKCNVFKTLQFTSSIKLFIMITRNPRTHPAIVLHMFFLAREHQRSPPNPNPTRKKRHRRNRLEINNKKKRRSECRKINREKRVFSLLLIAQRERSRVVGISIRRSEYFLYYFHTNFLWSRADRLISLWRLWSGEQLSGENCVCRIAIFAVAEHLIEWRIYQMHLMMF